MMISRIAFPPTLLVLGAVLLVACEDNPMAPPTARPAFAPSLLHVGRRNQRSRSHCRELRGRNPPVAWVPFPRRAVYYH